MSPVAVVDTTTAATGHLFFLVRRPPAAETVRAFGLEMAQARRVSPNLARRSALSAGLRVGNPPDPACAEPEVAPPAVVERVDARGDV